MTRLGKGWVNDLEFSPNGEILSVATSIGIYLYQVDTMALLTFLPSDALVTTTAFIDDKTMITGESDGSTIVWDIEDEPRILQTLQRADPVVELGVTDDNTILIVEFSSVGSPISINIISWDRVNPETVHRVSSEIGAGQFEYSPSKNTLLIGVFNRLPGKIIAVDAKRMKAVAVLTGYQSLALSQNGDLLAVNQSQGGANYPLLLLDITTQKEVATLENGGRPLAFTSDGKMLVSSSAEGLKFWNVDTLELVSTIGDARAQTAVFSPDGSLLASISRDGELALREISSGETRFSIQGFTSLGKIVFQDDYMASTYGYEPMSVSDVAAGGGGFYSSDSRTIFFRDKSNGEVIRSIELSEEEKDQFDALASITFSPDGKILASTWDNWSTGDGSILFLNPETGERLKTFSGSGPIAFSSDASLLATAGKENRLVVWDAESGEQLELSLGLVPEEFGEPYQKSLLFSPDDSMIVVLSSQVIFRDLTTGKQVKVLESGLDPYLSFYDRGGSGALGAFSPDGTILASTWLIPTNNDRITDSKGVIILWNVLTGEKITVLDGHLNPTETEFADTNSITALAFSPDGNLLASGAKDNTIVIWNVQDGSQLKVLEGHTGAINSLSFSSDGKLLYSNAMDGTVIIWNLEKLLP
ncbi:MAG: hypothetical protein DCC56_02790 [Anaerolineae bacterium]|nr:MAG: hypothetical protein DCC56_02790 [Anaerolineae bacterium]